jgi:hypothetical protein
MRLPLALLGMVVALADFPSYLSCSTDGCDARRDGRVAFMGLPGGRAGRLELKWVWDAKFIATATSTHAFLGCSSNGRLRACSLPMSPGCAVLNANGTLAWSSTACDGSTTSFSGSPPIVTDQVCTLCHFLLFALLSALVLPFLCIVLLCRSMNEHPHLSSG